MFVLRLVMIALLGYACAVQLNDPDGVFWIVLYGAAAVITGFSLRRPVRIAVLVALGVYLVALVVVVLGVTEWSVNDERSREAVGVAICALWMIVLSRLPGGPHDR